MSLGAAQNGPLPEVSVILPAHDRAAWLAEAVDSVLSQEAVTFELIVVDDGSRDATPQVLAAYGDRIRVLRLEHGGVARARNRGVAAGRGRLLAFLDSDDLWRPGKLAAQAAFMHTRPEIAICQTEEIWIRNGRRVNPRRRHDKTGGMIFERSLELCLVSPSAVMMRRSLFEACGGFDETLPACEDYDLWLRIGCRHPVGLIATPLVVKRGGHADQLSRLPGLDRYRIRAIAKILQAGVLNPSQEAAALSVLRAKCRIYAAGCRKRGRLEEARLYETLAADPDAVPLATLSGEGGAPAGRPSMQSQHGFTATGADGPARPAIDWRARHDSNVRPTDSKSGTLSN